MKFVIVTGGVLSGLGKGIVTSSIGLLLKTSGFKVTAVKIDPYVSVDAGTMRPAEHGEVFVTHDGGEIDQDVGNYERYLNINLSKDNNLTTGKIYQSVIDKERHFYYKGRDVEVIPDIINEIKERIYKLSEGYDFTLVEVGGTTGDLENMPFLHAAREIGREYPSVYVMVTYLPYLKNVGELKTKPTQHAVARLREIGIMPDFIVTRNEIPLDAPRIETIAKRCFVEPDHIIDDPDLDYVHKLPIMFEEKKFADKILGHFNLKKSHNKTFEKWQKYVDNLENNDNPPAGGVKIALIGKYVKHGGSDHKDVYVSVLEALNHAASYHKIGLHVDAINSDGFEKLSEKKIKEKLENYDGVVIPQGWGSRGVEGKIAAIKYARENNLPYLGLCFGMQMAAIEFARNVLGLKKANSEEVNPNTVHRIIHMMPNQKKYLAKNQYGGTIRLGAWPAKLTKNSRLNTIYKKYGKNKKSPWYMPRNDSGNNLSTNTHNLIYERHRHRYEFNNKYREQFEKAGIEFSALSPDNKLVEAIELKDHPFFIGTQFHPEYMSRPLSPHPIFVGFLHSAIKHST